MCLYLTLKAEESLNMLDLGRKEGFALLRNQSFASRVKVLFIDDAQDIAEVCKIVLEGQNYEIETATTGRAGIEMALFFSPEVVFLDMSLPDIPGFEVARRIFSAVPIGKKKPTIYAFTSFQPEFIEKDLIKSGIPGIRRCIQKPMDIVELEEILKEAISTAVISA